MITSEIARARGSFGIVTDVGIADALCNCETNRSRNAQCRELRIRNSLMRTASTISSRSSDVM